MSEHAACETVSHDATVKAIHLFHCWRGDPIGALSPALDSEPPQSTEAAILKAWLLVLGTEPTGYDEARSLVRALELRTTCARHLQHAQAIDAFVDGEWTQASRLLEDLNLRHPQDSVALQAGHLVDYYLGDARMLRERVLRAMPHFSPGHPHRHAVLSMAAFGAVECGDFLEAERLGRQALALEPLDAWGHHAVAHAFEMRGDAVGGNKWMAERAAHWREPSYLAVHNAWHWALFLIAMGRLDDALALYDREVRGSGSRQIVDLVDASALLLRLRIAGHDPGPRWEPLLNDWAGVLRPGAVLFNDLHLAWTALGAGRVDLIEGLLEVHRRQAEKATSEPQRISRDLGVPIMGALLSLSLDRPASAVVALRGIRPDLHRIGGSRAQRELVELVLIDAALRAGQSNLAAALIHARTLQRSPRPEAIRATASPTAAIRFGT